ncbi:hypothetical protein, partial [Rhodovulum sulfidophilum]|uniref:hypothetical protein n=1 Tax=Rhodovulum sulfidophilum TaxID=35806 RepID=UPI001F35C6D9
QTGKGPSRNAETAKRLTGKALALSSAANILRSQTGVFQQNRLGADLRRRSMELEPLGPPARALAADSSRSTLPAVAR